MDWFYPQILKIHVVMAWVTLGLFIVRGLAYQLGYGAAKDGAMMLIAFGANTLMIITGLSLWGSLYYSIPRDGWLLGKLIALLAYFAASHLAFSLNPQRALGYGAGVLALAYAMAAAYTRQGLLVG
ncbi:SirB2 family protein [Pelomonas sp. SE-A7]|uniref:SirB2 family protein n=1 Tax=Pelomonas sp. SE-A7 TaxID=3054953 RepID=UPI00259D1BDC|nr:SirB2 family protein [Pelomonas sp. SE-A7]MDM4765942.1 SirB2 family protein [Pelomonas sp. SE-A7]